VSLSISFITQIRTSTLQHSSPLTLDLIKSLGILASRPLSKKKKRWNQRGQSRHLKLIQHLHHDMVVNHIALTPKALITSAPMSGALILDRQASSKKCEYPTCRSDPNSPCALCDRSKELCSREFVTWLNGCNSREYHSQRTNGYYAQSSE
jgi:hypothetical protein